MNETTLFYNWAVVIGLSMSSAVLTFFIIMLLAWGFKAMNIVRMKSYRNRMSILLENVYYANYESNHDLAVVAEKLLAEIDAQRAAKLTKAADGK